MYTQQYINSAEQQERITEALQPSDIHQLGFFDPIKACQPLTQKHARLMQRYESQSRYDGYRKGPDERSLVSSTAFITLESTKQDDVIKWYEQLAQIAASYQIGISPFAHIELAYGPVGLCLPGVGGARYDEMGRALALLLSTKLLPMNDNSNDSELSLALELPMDPEDQNGYEILHVLLKKTVAAFDDEHLELTWPRYHDFDTPTQYAEAVRTTVMLAAKRNQPYKPKQAELQFLEHIINEAGPNYRVEVQLLRNQVRAFDPNISRLPREYTFKAMATEIIKSKTKEPADPDLRQYPIINKVNRGQDKAVQSQDGGSMMCSATGTEWNEHLQGFQMRQYCINENNRRPN